MCWFSIFKISVLDSTRTFRRWDWRCRQQLKSVFLSLCSIDPNPLGGHLTSGHVLESQFRSFVGQYPIPILHGLTVGELAQMIKGERWLDGLNSLDLRIMQMQGWQRTMRWPATRLPWVPTSPNIPTFEASLLYPGIGLVGETQLVNEGRGTPRPFTQFGAPWLDARRLAYRLNRIELPGLAFEATRYTPSIHSESSSYSTFRRSLHQRRAHSCASDLPGPTS